MKKITIALSLLLFGLSIQAQEGGGHRIPKYGFGIAGGITKSELAGADLDGIALRVRGVYVLDTFPILGFMLDGTFKSLDLTQGASEVGAKEWSLSPGLITMIPFDMKTGLGLPLYISYDAVNTLKFDGFSESLDGTGFRYGFQIPIPIELENGSGFMFDIFYQDIEYDNARQTFGTDEVNVDGWTVLFQYGVPLDWY